LFHIHVLILVGKYSNRTIILTKLLWDVIWFWLRNPTNSIQDTWRICFDKNCYKTIVSHTPQLVSNSYKSQIWHLASFKPSTKAACYCVEFGQVLLTLVERFIMLLRSRSCTLHIHMLLLHWEYTQTCFHLDPPKKTLLLGVD
jgi:hypothetical protein